MRTIARLAVALAGVVIFGAGTLVTADAATTNGATPVTISQPAVHAAKAAMSPASASPASYSSCIQGDFCAWSGANGTGTKKAWYICQTVTGHPFSTTNGSFYNNQTGGAPTKIYFSDGSILTVYPGVTGTGINWKTVTKIRTCP
jgi:hypothetical protein